MGSESRNCDMSRPVIAVILQCRTHGSPRCGNFARNSWISKTSKLPSYASIAYEGTPEPGRQPAKISETCIASPVQAWWAHAGLPSHEPRDRQS